MTIFGNIEKIKMRIFDLNSDLHQAIVRGRGNGEGEAERGGRGGEKRLGWRVRFGGVFHSSIPPLVIKDGPGRSQQGSAVFISSKVFISYKFLSRAELSRETI